MQNMFTDNHGITYAILHIIIGIIIIGGIWIINGVIIDEFNLISNTLVAINDLWGDKTQNGFTELNKLWNLVLWVLMIASLFYGIITAIRKERRGID